MRNQRTPSPRWTAFIALAIFLSIVVTPMVSAITPNTIEAFEAGNGGWTGIPGGSYAQRVTCQDASCLKIGRRSAGAAGIMNTSPWSGDFFESGIVGVEIQASARMGDSKVGLPLRIGLRSSGSGGSSCFVSESPVSIAGKLTAYRFDLDVSDMKQVSCGGSAYLASGYRDALATIDQLRIYVAESPQWEPNGPSRTFIVDSVRVIAATATQWRFIGQKTHVDNNCPVPSSDNWVTGHLFGETDEPLVAGSNSNLTGELRRYCVMELKAEEGLEATPQETATVMQLVGRGLDLAQPDLVAVLPGTRVASDAGQSGEKLAPADLAQAVGEVVLLGMAERFASYAGRPAGDMPYPHFVSDPPRPSAIDQRTHLALLDTTSDFATEAGQSWHGETLARAAAALACVNNAASSSPSSAGCSINIQPRVALSFRPSTCSKDLRQTNPGIFGECRDTAKGGATGMIGELAQSIHRETARLRDGRYARLVLNGSIGWNRVYGGDQSKPRWMPLASRAVYHALEDTRCAGALPVFASGNSLSGPSDMSGSSYPGAWVGRDGPDFDRCEDLETAAAPAHAGRVRFAASAGAGLVVAVGGVQANHRPLSNVPLNSEPRFVAYGDSLAIADGSSWQPTPFAALTGTSSAAIVAATTMAVAWHYQPDQSGYQLEESIYKHSLALDRDVTLGLPGHLGGAKPVHFVRMCDVIAAICPSGVGLCPASECDAPSTPSSLAPQTIDQKLSCVGSTPSSCTGTIPTFDFDGKKFECNEFKQRCDGPGGQQRFCYVAGSTPSINEVCPHLNYYSTAFRTTTNPAPEDRPCPACTGTAASPGKVHIAIDPEWGVFGPDSADKFALKAMTLHCDGVNYLMNSLAKPDQPYPSRMLLKNVPEECTESERMFLSFRVDSPASSSVLDEPLSIINPIFRVRDSDRDGIINIEDNCVDEKNEHQRDRDNNGIGDVCQR